MTKQTPKIEERMVPLDKVIKYMRSGKIAGGFSEGCDCEDCNRYEQKVRKALMR